MKSLMKPSKKYTLGGLLLIPTSLWLTGCQSEISMNYQLEKPLIRKVFREATYSTYIDDLEHIGTVNRTYYNEGLTPQDGGIKYVRKYVNDGSSKGFLRKTNAIEIAYRTDIEALSKAGEFGAIKGFEKFDKEVVDGIALPSYFVNRLKSQAFKIRQIPDVKEWWVRTHTLQGTVKTKSVLKGQALAAFAQRGLTIDSLVIDDLKKVEGEKCLRYELYFKASDPLNIMLWEQHRVALGERGNELEGYLFDSAESSVRHEIFQDPETGLLCREREYRESENKIKHKDSGAIRSFKSVRVVETLYEYEKGED